MKLIMPGHDAIKPDYYKTDSIYEPWKIIDAYGLDFYLGNALKYLLRAGNKAGNPMEQDLKKAVEYINHVIEKEKSKK
jgi:hypothetical protein